MDTEVENTYREVSDLRGEPPDDLSWAMAIRDRWVAEYLSGEIALDELADQLDRYSNFQDSLKLAKKESGTTARKEIPDSYRQWAMNQIFAIDAAQIDLVQAFRTEWLPERLLNMAEVDAWVMERKRVEGPASTWITTLADEGGNPIVGNQNCVGYAESSRLIRFVVPDRRWIRSEAVNAVGALIELTTTSEMLHRRYDWSEAWAATFILTGIVPPVVVAHWTINEPRPWLKARRRVTITVRPDVQPTRLVEMYREKRNELLRGEPMPRAIGEHKAKLAVFAAKHSAGYTWGETMRLWNRENSDHEFASEPRFTRDSRDAFNRVMNEPLHWKGKTARREDRNGPH